VRARCFLAALVETSFPPACARNGIPSKGGEREREREVRHYVTINEFRQSREDERSS